MKRLCIWVWVLLSGLLTLQAQEIQPHAPQILGLICQGQALSSLDVSGCTSLTRLEGGTVGSLDISGCTALEKLIDVRADTLKIHGMSMDTLKLATGQIKILDASGCTSLKRLEGGRVGSLDISGCTALEKLIDVSADTLKIHGKSMSTLELYDVDGNYIVDGSRSSIGVLDASGCTSLTGLGCAFSVRNSLDVSGCTALKILHCRGNQLTRLDLNGCTALEYLSCDNNQLSSLDVSGCTALTNLSCYSNQLSSLDVSGCTALTSLSCYSNQLSSLDVSGCTALTSLSCYNNQLSSLDVSGCTALTNLSCYSNQLSSLDVSGCTALTNLSCYSNQLSSLDVSGCTSLASLSCYYNQLNSLDVSGCISLKKLTGITADTLRIYGESMDTLTIEGWKVSIYHYIYYEIGVLDAAGCTTLRRITCTPYSDSYASLATIDRLNLQGCTSLTGLDCSDIRLSILDVSGCTALTSLDCSSNRLSILDVSGCTALTSLDCRSNVLTSLDVSKNTSLSSLDCSNNRLSSLDVSGCTALASLDCHSNDLTSLDVSKNTSLSSLNCEDNRIPLSVLYKAYSQNSNWGRFAAGNQSDSTTILVNRPFDLSSERIVGQTLTTFILKDGYNRDVASDFWTENKFVFQFHEPLNYKLSLENKVVGSYGTTFTWYISVVEEMPVRYFTVQVASNNAGWGTATITGNGTYEEGTEVTITATSKEGYRFINWTGKDGSVFSTEAVHTFTVSENVELTANFEKLPEDVETFTVAVAANNAEWGRVSQTGDGRYEKDEEVTVTAKANAGYRFVDWTKKDGSVFSTEAVHTFAVTENMELTANFERLPETETFTVSLSSNNPSWGIVSLIGNGICERGDAITIIATPMMGCRFINWTRKDGSVFSTEAVHTFEVTENLELTANFERNVGNESHGDDDFYVYVQDHTIHLPAERGLVQVYSATGVCVYSGHATAIPVKSSGLYIVRVGERAYKAMVR